MKSVNTRMKGKLNNLMRIMWIISIRYMIRIVWKPPGDVGDHLSLWSPLIKSSWLRNGDRLVRFFFCHAVWLAIVRYGFSFVKHMNPSSIFPSFFFCSSFSFESCGALSALSKLGSNRSNLLIQAFVKFNQIIQQ